MTRRDEQGNVRYYEIREREMERRLHDERLPQTMRKILADYDQANKGRGITPSSRANHVRWVAMWGRFLIAHKKTFKQATKKDIENFLEDRSVSWTNSLKYILKFFYRWLFWKTTDKTKGYPELVSWLRLKRERPRPIEPAKLITTQDVHALLKTARHPRDKCLIAILYETGLRLGELLSLRIKNVVFEQEYCWLNVQSGKTGARPVLIYESIPYVQEWLNRHPDGKNPEAYLIVNKQNLKEAWEGAIEVMLSRLAKRADLKKRIYPHLFRHTSATNFAREGYNEPEMNLRFGWTPQSRMAARYTHMTHSDLAERILQKKGLAKPKSHEELSLLPKLECKRCKKTIPSEAVACAYCGMLTSEEAQKALQEHKLKEKEMVEMKRELLIQKKMLEMLSKKLSIRKEG